MEINRLIFIFSKFPHYKQTNHYLLSKIIKTVIIFFFLKHKSIYKKSRPLVSLN